MRVEVAKLPSNKEGINALRLLARLCYYYPQYTLAEARSLPYKHVMLLLKEARVQKAVDWHWQTLIAAAPHTEKGKAVKQLLKKLKEQM